MDSNLLVVPRTNLHTYGDRAFGVAAPTLWNELPAAIRAIDDRELFKNRLKSHLFSSAFENIY